MLLVLWALGGAMITLSALVRLPPNVVYLAWASVVIAMYPLCPWFAAVKQRRSDAWLSYL